MTGSLTVGEPPPLTFSRWVAGVIARWKTVILAITVTAALAALAVFLIPPVYQARASFVPNTSSAAKLPSGLSGGGALGGIASQLGLGATSDPTESPDFYSDLIRSRELGTRLLNSRFDDPRTALEGDSVRLLDLFRIKHDDPVRRMEIGLKLLGRATDVTFFEKTNLVKLGVSTEWPKLSAEVANRTLDFVSEFNREQRTSRARSNRIFLETRVSRARSELEAAEARLRYFYDQNRSYRSSPALVSQEQQLQRDVDRTAELFLTLQRQLETALLEEVNNAALITVVDSAVEPRKPQWPRYGLLLISVLVGGTILGVMLAGSAAVLEDWRARNPADARYLGGTVRNVSRQIGGTFRGRTDRKSRHNA